MDDCCSDKACALQALQERQAATLKIVLLINATMFLVEIVAGLLAGSVALLADSLDMLGDALVYGLSLYVVARGAAWKARAALAKAAAMALFGAFVLGQLVYRLVNPELPAPDTMGTIGSIAMAANATCLVLLWRHRAEDINMRSVWLCSRNDLFANAGVLLAALAVWALHSSWPDLVVGALICAMFLRSAATVTREALDELRENRQRTAPADLVP
jgi:cation diffusion facilitator family transporter